MASRSEKDLTQDLQDAWSIMSVELKAAGYDALLTCTHRSNEEQAALYAQGRTKPGLVVTKAKPGQSKHNAYPAEAFDIAIMVGGKLCWDISSPAWKLATEIGERLGLHQLTLESCHFEK